MVNLNILYILIKKYYFIHSEKNNEQVKQYLKDMQNNTIDLYRERGGRRNLEKYIIK